MSIYQFNVQDIYNQEVSLSQYQDKILLIFNSATGCGFTPQYEGIETLYKKYRDQGFEVLDFPCNQFMNQAPGSSEELAQFCQLKFNTTFQTFAKIDVNGKNASPLFTYLKQNSLEHEDNQESSSLKKTLKNLKQNLMGSDISWNFTKFLVNQNGDVIRRYPPNTSPLDIEADIVELFAKLEN